jgi:hypothetical protein
MSFAFLTRVYYETGSVITLEQAHMHLQLHHVNNAISVKMFLNLDK